MASRRRDAGALAGRLAASWLLPGAAQWCGGCRARAAAFAGMHASALLTALVAWGTWLGPSMVAVAFATHVAAMADALGRRAFPGFIRGVPVSAIALALALGLYGPALLAAWQLARPVERCGAPAACFLVDRGAFVAVPPRLGDWVCFQRPDGQGFDVGRALAGPRQDVEWHGDHVHVAGRELSWRPGALAPSIRELALTVPDGHWLLIDPAPPGGGDSALMLVPAERIVGRAWAQVYPLGARRFLL
jgi:hypothetical protein